jgi:hypothetical protein
MVPLAKLEAWLMLMIVSYSLTALVNRPSAVLSAAQPAAVAEPPAALEAEAVPTR